MGLPSFRNGLVTALIAAFVAVFVLTAAVDAAACAPEAAVAGASGSVADDPSDNGLRGGPDDHAICAHGHCHHGGLIAFDGSDAPADVVAPREQRRIPPTELLASRTPSGLERPPRG